MTVSSTPKVERRRFLMMVGAVATAAAVSYGLPAEAEAGRGARRTIYFLDPEWGAGDPACPIPHQGGGGCHACVACHNHDANKMWTSAALADRSRAHPNCKCLISSKNVNNREYITIFGPPSGPLHRDEFDIRRDRLFLPPQAIKGGL